MVGWEVSRHPEWDLMYAAGLTLPEIVAISKAPRSTVHRHLQVREEYEPGARARHEAAVAKRPHFTGPTSTWVQHLADVLTFKSTHGRLPEAADGGKASKMNGWIQAQRRERSAGTLKPEAEVALQLLGDWTTDAGAIARQSALDDHWRARLAELVEFVTDTGSEPRYKRFTSEHEHTLGVWLHIQTQHRTQRTLPAWREAELDAAVPGWHSHQ